MGGTHSVINSRTRTENHFDYVFKMMVIGDVCVGKSSLIVHFEENIFNPMISPTIGVDIAMKTVKLDSFQIKLQMWDVPGQLRFKYSNKKMSRYCRGLDGVMVVFDVTNQTSFDSVQDWLNPDFFNKSKKTPVLLVGNKCDLADQRVVDYSTTKAYAEERDMIYIETSAKESVNVEEAFTTLTAMMKESKDEQDRRQASSRTQHIRSQHRMSTRRDRPKSPCQVV